MFASNKTSFLFKLFAFETSIRDVVPLINKFGLAAIARVNVPVVVTVGIPVFVNNPVIDGSTVKDTDMTEPVPAEGLTQERVVPFEDKYCPEVPTVERPVPPNAVGNGPPETLIPPAPNATGPDGLTNVNGAVLLLFIRKELPAVTAYVI